VPARGDRGAGTPGDPRAGPGPGCPRRGAAATRNLGLRPAPTDEEKARHYLWRFQDREKTPYKKCKITDENYRNRDRWVDYVDAINEMVGRSRRRCRVSTCLK
ncbi:MAG: hypothetical protein DRQ97_13180, partial [Gammaproteobacteria bacterium]